MRKSAPARRTVVIAAVAPVTAPQPVSGYVRVRIPATIDPGTSGDYPGLRVVGSTGDVPFALDLPIRPQQPLHDVPFRGFIARGNARVAIADAGDDGTLHDMLAIASTYVTFFERVAVDASDDRRVWRTVRADAIVFRSQRGERRESTCIGFAPTRKRWIRLRFRTARRAFELDRIAVGTAGQPLPEPPLVPVAAAGSRDRDAAAGTRAWTFDLGASDRRVDALRFAGGAALFERTVALAASDDGIRWNDIGGGTISRFRYGAPRLEIGSLVGSARFWRVTLIDGDDPPPAGLAPVLLAQPHDVVFFARAGETYRLVDEGPGHSVAAYDLADRLAHDHWHATMITVAWPALSQPAAAWPRASTAWRNGVFIVAALILGGFAVQTFLSGEPNGTQRP